MWANCVDLNKREIQERKMIPSNLRIALIVLLLAYFIIILYFLKKKALTLRYTLLWLLSGLVMGIMVIWPEILSFIIGLVGIQSNMNGLFVMAIGFIIIILMSLTSIATKQRQKIKSMIQEMGMLEARIRQLEEEIDKK